MVPTGLAAALAACTFVACNTGTQALGSDSGAENPGEVRGVAIAALPDARAPGIESPPDAAAPGDFQRPQCNCHPGDPLCSCL
jgi:hypothetical protein